MLTFERLFDVRRLEPFIRSFTRNETAQVHVKVFGQEKSGDILFLFDCQSLVTSATVTHIGVYGQATGQCKVVYSAEGAAEIVSCTINQSHTLMLFTEHQPAEARRKTSNYSLCVVNLQSPQKTKVSKFQRPYHIEPHFLYGNSHEKASRALVLVHTECVRLYHFSGEGGEKAAAAEYTEVFKAHEWYQWQPSVECLFLVYPSACPASSAGGSHDSSAVTRSSMGRQPSMPILQLPNRQRSESPPSPSDDMSVDIRDQIRSYLVGIAFNEKFVHRRVFEVGISLPPATGLIREYDHGLLSGCVPDRKLNARVLTFPSGNVAFCSQVSGSVSAHLEPNTVEYVVTSVLHGHTLTVRVPHVSTTLQKYPEVFFASYYNYVLVYLPGNFVHLIDVNSHLDMTYHIIGDSKQSKCSHRTEGRCGRLSSFSDGSSVEFYDPYEGCAYNAKLSEQALLNLFCSTHSQLIRGAILRMALLYYEHSGMATKIIRLLRNDAGSPEVQNLLTEYIFGSAYREVKRHLNALSGCALPFTVADVFKNEGIRVHSRDSSKVRLKYTHEGNVSYYDQQRQASGDGWWLNCNSQLLARGCCGRLPFRSVFRRPDARVLESVSTARGRKSGASGGSDKKKNRFISKLMGLISGKQHTMQHASEKLQERLTAAANASPTTSHLEACLGIDVPADADGVANARSEVAAAETAALLRSIPALLSGSEGKHFLDPAPDLVLHRMIELLDKKLSSVASALAVVNSEATSVTDALTEYVSAICQKLQELPVLLWSQSGLVLADDLTLLGQWQDVQKTFHLFERYYAAVCDLGLPVSRGFATVFSVLGFHALTPRIFLQYVDSGIISLANVPQQLQRLLLNESKDSTQTFCKWPNREAVLAQCVCRLTKEEALNYCQFSQAPWAVQHMGEHILSSCVATNESWVIKLPPDSLRSYSADGGSAPTAADTLDYAAHDSYQMLLGELKRLHLDENVLARAAFANIRVHSERTDARRRDRSSCRPTVRAATL